ncbi:uncharacterized protein CLUP02_12935 [Colletotrichum lupini]|uniref:Uncharacterized protein n=1 Tax=Colletotrichum lupini TaxID=145971 RepID=A0A9Q8T268_9PEZI|nr:uncharacterized protein CLUP02_12935 [Colletotrichum lupini]UQC87430.1 hypothetical protein CLUP02_12935 [Colletotrichum lupini]
MNDLLRGYLLNRPALTLTLGVSSLPKLGFCTDPPTSLDIEYCAQMAVHRLPRLVPFPRPLHGPVQPSRSPRQHLNINDLPLYMHDRPVGGPPFPSPSYRQEQQIAENFPLRSWKTLVVSLQSGVHHQPLGYCALISSLRRILWGFCSRIENMTNKTMEIVEMQSACGLGAHVYRKNGDIDFRVALPSLVLQSTVHITTSAAGHGNPKNPGPDRRQQLIGPPFSASPSVPLSSKFRLSGSHGSFVRDKNQQVPNHTWIRGVQVGLFEISFWPPAIPRQLASYRIPRAAPDHDSMRYLIFQMPPPFFSNVQSQSSNLPSLGLTARGSPRRVEKDCVCVPKTDANSSGAQDRPRNLTASPPPKIADTSVPAQTPSMLYTDHPYDLPDLPWIARTWTIPWDCQKCNDLMVYLPINSVVYLGSHSRLLSPKFNLSLIAANFSSSTTRDALSPTGHRPVLSPEEPRKLFTQQCSVPAPGSRAWDEPPWFTRVPLAFHCRSHPFLPATRQNRSVIHGCIESFGPHRGTARKGALAIRSFMLCGAGLAVGTNMFDALSPNTRILPDISHSSILFCNISRHASSPHLANTRPPSAHVHLPHPAIYKQRNDKALQFLQLLGNPRDHHINAGKGMKNNRRLVRHLPANKVAALPLMRRTASLSHVAQRFSCAASDVAHLSPDGIPAVLELMRPST